MAEDRDVLGFCRAVVCAETVLYVERHLSRDPGDREAAVAVFQELFENDRNQLARVFQLLNVPTYAAGMLSSMLSEVVQFRAAAFRAALRRDKGDRDATDGDLLAWWLEQYLNSEWTAVGLS